MTDPAPTLDCDHFVPGHVVHWVQALRVAKPIATVTARFDGFDPDGGGRLMLTFPDGHTERRWNHDARKVANLLGGEGRSCCLKTTGLLIVGVAGGPALCLSDEPNRLPHCPPRTPLPPFTPRVPTVHHTECTCDTCAHRGRCERPERTW